MCFIPRHCIVILIVVVVTFIVSFLFGSFKRDGIKFSAWITTNTIVIFLATTEKKEKS